MAGYYVLVLKSVLKRVKSVSKSKVLLFCHSERSEGSLPVYIGE